MKNLCSFKQLTWTILSTVLVLSLLQVSSAQIRTSSNYQLQADSINFGGGFSSSSNFAQESTFGEVGTGESSSSNYQLKAGYQQMVTSYISISNVSNVVMSPNIPGLGGGTSNGSTSVLVITDNSGGYSLTIESENTPAMQKGADTIADYAPVSDPDLNFTTTVSDSHFGYTPDGPDVVQRFLENAGSCNQLGGNSSSTACWDGLSTTAVEIASDTNPNQPTGATTTVYFRVGVGSGAVVPPGDYYATSTLTAITL